MILLLWSWFFSFPLSQLFLPLAVLFFCSCWSGGCLFPNTFEPAYLGLYYSGFLAPFVIVPSAHRYHATISIQNQPACDSKNQDCFDRQCVWVWLQSMLSLWMTVGSFARVGSLPAPELVCQNAFRACAWLEHIPCQHHPSMLPVTVYLCWGHPFFSHVQKKRIELLMFCHWWVMFQFPPTLMFQQSF